jgi:hypothetical protein
MRQSPEQFAREALAFALQALQISNTAYEQAADALNAWDMRRFMKMNALANAAAVAASLVADSIDASLLPLGQQGTLSLIVSEAMGLVDQTSEARQAAQLHANPEEAHSSTEWQEQLSMWEAEGQDFVNRYKQQAEKWMSNTFDLCIVGWKGMRNDNLPDDKRIKLARLVRTTSKVGAGLARALSNSPMASDFVDKGQEALEYLKFQKKRVMPRGVRVRRVLTPEQEMDLVAARQKLRAEQARTVVTESEAKTVPPARQPQLYVPTMAKRMTLAEVEAFLGEEEE